MHTPFIGFTGEIQIHGIVFARDDVDISEDAWSFWYSDIDGIVAEFGSITTH